MSNRTTVSDWDSALYKRAIKQATGLTDKGIRIALNQAHSLKPEAVEAYKDVLRHRGWSDMDLMRVEMPPE